MNTMVMYKGLYKTKPKQQVFDNASKILYPYPWIKANDPCRYLTDEQIFEQSIDLSEAGPFSAERDSYDQYF